MGMGLPICSSIVEAHAVRRTVERLNPYGTRFEVRLPEPGRRHPDNQDLVPDSTRVRMSVYQVAFPDSNLHYPRLPPPRQIALENRDEYCPDWTILLL
jgi:hypothetical protein